MTTTVRLVREVTMDEVNEMLEWLKHIEFDYKFTGIGMELLRFENDNDALMFKLRFNI